MDKTGLCVAAGGCFISRPHDHVRSGLNDDKTVHGSQSGGQRRQNSDAMPIAFERDLVGDAVQDRGWEQQAFRYAGGCA